MICHVLSGTLFRLCNARSTPRYNEECVLPYYDPELERFFEANHVIVHRDAHTWYPVLDGAFDPSNTFCT